MLKGILAYIIALTSMQLFTQSPKRGAEPLIRVALDPSVTTVDYYGPSGFKEMRGKAVLTQAFPHAHNEQHAKSLQELSEKLANTKFNV